MNAQSFRRTTGRFATGVTVVTAASGDEIHGMTANSFVSVSLDPLLVLVAVANGARMCERLKSAGAFGISILRADQKAQSNVFAGAWSEDTVEFSSLGGQPVVADSLAALGCSLYETFQCGDHTLCVGEVHAMSCGEGEPLLFYDGVYAALENYESPNYSPDLSGNIVDVVFELEGFNAVGW